MSSRVTALTNLQPKTTFYWADGTGRDMYITTDNGGSVAGRPITAKFDNSVGRTRAGSSALRRSIDPKVVHYHTDGTGRDVYIGLNDGGLTDLRGSREGFASSLRTYKPLQPIRPYSKRDYFVESQLLRSSVERDKSANIFEKQKKLISRLSTPKRREEALIRKLEARRAPRLPTLD